MHKVLTANKQAKPLGSDRRDEMRCALRAKISQKDYVDKEMKHFHYGKSGVNNGAMIYNGVLMGQQPVQGGNVATQIAAAQHLLYLQQKHSQQVEEEQLAELAMLQAEQKRIINENQSLYE